MAFVAAMSAQDTTKVGVNGSDVYTEAGVGDRRVTLYSSLVRRLSATNICNTVESLMKGSLDVQRDLVVMAFQTRDIRGGKGERVLFYELIGAILRERPEWAYVLLTLVPEYGCWRDLWELYTAAAPSVREVIHTIVLEQWKADTNVILPSTPSLLAKWLPREGSRYSSLATRFASIFFPDVTKEDGARKRAYRKAVADMNRRIDTTEIKMCGRTWAEISPRKVPGRLMKRNKKAFFNQTKKGAIRYPDNADRIACREHFEAYMGDVKTGKETIKGAHTVLPHEHVHEFLYNHTITKEIVDVIEAQWAAIRDATAKAGGLDRCVFMCDFSGSMSGVPMEVSLALGILGSEIASPAFKDHILGFSETPMWISFVGKETLREKVSYATENGFAQGLSTNFQAAADKILERLIEHKVPVDMAPTDLIVLTDMGFDSASKTGSYMYKTSSWQTHFDMIHQAFQKHGYEPPRIVCWNLRSEYTDYHARALTVGVVQLSGWSPSAFKAITAGGVRVETPYEGLRRILDDVRYDKVRSAFMNAVSKNRV
jgi:hypothetical protein